MTIPDYQACMLPFLRQLADGHDHSASVTDEVLAEHFSLTPAERVALLPSGQQSVFKNRVGWARTHIKKAGLIESPKRGVFRITPRGREVLASLVSWVPGIVWLSENKPLVFGVATTMMLASAVAQRAAERLPCPADPALAAACAANRRRGRWLFRVSLALLLVGATFAFVLPALLAV